jgi:Sulfotransferase domain
MYCAGMIQPDTTTFDPAIIGNKPVSNYKRQPPPLIIRYFFSFVLYGILGPINWISDKLGYQDLVLRFMTASRIRNHKKRNPFRKYVPTKHDVFVATFAKSGTNWMMQIAHQLAFHGNGEYDHIHCVVPWPDTELMGPMRKYAVPIEDPFVWKASPEQKRVIKTHFDWEFVPYSEDARYIMVIRDPKDVFVSSWFFFVKDGFLAPIIRSVDDLFRIFMTENFPIGGSWAVNTAGYWAQRHRPNVMIVSFKSMKHDLRGTVRKVADFLGVNASEGLIDLVCEKSSFDYMKRIDDKFRTWKMLPWKTEAAMIRAGKQGGSSELLSREQQRQIDAFFMAELKRLGSDFPYEQFCDITQ